MALSDVGGTWIDFSPIGSFARRGLILAAIAAAVLLTVGFASYKLWQQTAAANFQQLSAELNSAGYTEEALKRFLSSCNVRNCPASLHAAAEKRLDIIGRERSSYQTARSNLQLLQTYIETCSACEFRDAAKVSVAQLQTKQLYDDLNTAGTNSSAIASFLTRCGASCPDAVHSEANVRLQAAKRTELARSEEATYNAARGNIEKLQAYLSCTICTSSRCCPAGNHRPEASSDQQSENRQCTGTHKVMQICCKGISIRARFATIEAQRQTSETNCDAPHKYSLSMSAIIAA